MVEMLFEEKEKKDQQLQCWEEVFDFIFVECQYLIKMKEQMVKNGNDLEGR